MDNEENDLDDIDDDNTTHGVVNDENEDSYEDYDHDNDNNDDEDYIFSSHYKISKSCKAIDHIVSDFSVDLITVFLTQQHVNP